MNDTLYNIWPNGIKEDANGNAIFYPLGDNKTTIPDGVDKTWLEGNALIGNFVFKNGFLNGFVDTKALIPNPSRTTTMPYDYIKIHLDNIKENDITINTPNCEYCSITFGEGGTKYKNCTSLAKIKEIDPDFLINDIADGVWYQSLESLKSAGTLGEQIFFKCSSLHHFISNLSSLTSGVGMFYMCPNLKTFFASNLDKMTDGNQMFHTCSNLTSFEGDLSSMYKGNYMFYGCSNLTSFKGDLRSLTNGYWMFANCNLDTDSIRRISSTIKDVNSMKDSYDSSLQNTNVCTQISIRIKNNAPSDEENGLFEEIAKKGWHVYVNSSYNYIPQSDTGAASIPADEELPQLTPFYAKPMEVSQEYAEYIGEDGKYYNILGAQFIYVPDPETYGMFLSEEDAAANMRLTKIQK